MSNNNKNCILYLIRSSDEDLEMLNKSLELLQKNLLSSLKQDVDILIFHEKDFESYKDNVLKLKNMKFIEIEFKMPDYPKEIMDQIPTPYFPHPTHWQGPIAWNVSPGFSIGYRKMISFFFKDMIWLDELKNYNYCLRLDNDSYIWTKVPYDIFEVAQQKDSTYTTVRQAIQIDHPKVVEGLNNITKKWLLENNIETEINIDTIPNGKMYYTNIELLNLDWFRNNKNYKAFTDFIHENGFVYKFRWGDAPLRYLALNLFEKQNKIDYFQEFKYQHGAEFWCS